MMNILQLTDDCLFMIIDQIKENCENCEPLQDSNGKNLYIDLLHFSLANDRFSHLISHRYSDLLDEPILFYLNTNDYVQIELTKLYNRMKQLPKDKEKYWSILMNALKSNTEVVDIDISYELAQYNNDYLGRFNCVIDVLRHKRGLDQLKIDLPYSYLNDIQYFPKVERLSLNAKFDTKELAEYCELNPKLLELEVLHNEINGRITDILPYCKKLECLKVKVKCDYIAEYKSIVDLPLSTLAIAGEEGTNCSLSPLIHELIRKNPETLSCIQLQDFLFNFEEIAQLFQLEALKSLKLGDYRVENYVCVSKENLLWTLEISFEEPNDLTDLSAVVTYISISRIEINRFSHKIGTLKPLLNAISMQENPQLTYFGAFEEFSDFILDESNFPRLTSEEITELFKIRSLTEINFTVYKPFVVSSPLPKIRELRIKQIYSRNLTNLFRALALQENSELEKLEIHGNLSEEEKLAISRLETSNLINVKIIESRDIPLWITSFMQGISAEPNPLN